MIDIQMTDGASTEYKLHKVQALQPGYMRQPESRSLIYGEQVKAGDVLADGPATDHGEISLGKNALIGFMTWEGYNYEDAVLINEKLVMR